MEKISAACAMEWSIELEKGLRSKRPGQPLETISVMGPRLLRWSMEPIVTMAVSNMFGLVQGEDRLFANTILLRLADAFQTGDVNVRACILEVFLLELKYRRKKGKKYNGILAKQRVPNYIELLKRTKLAFDTGDVESRALSLRLFGCWADFAKDSAEVRHMVLVSLESCHDLEIKASLFAAGCFSELSEDFACVALVKLYHMINSPSTSSVIKLAAARTFSCMRCSSSIAKRAYKIGRMLLLDSAMKEFEIQMLFSLSKLAFELIILIPEQVNLLLSFLCEKFVPLVAAAALKCFHFLTAGGINRLPIDAKLVFSLFSMIENSSIPLNSQLEALKVLRKVFCYTLPDIEMYELLKLTNIAENAAKFYNFSKRYLSLALLVSMSCSLKRKMGEHWFHFAEVLSTTDTSLESPQHSIVESDGHELVLLPWKVSLLIVDQVRCLMEQVESNVNLGKLISGSNPCSASFNAKQECEHLLNLVLSLVREFSSLGLMVLEKVKVCMEALLRTYNAFKRESVSIFEGSSEMDLDTENLSSSSCEIMEVEGQKHAQTVSELLICLSQFTSSCFEALDEAGAVTSDTYNIIKQVVQCIQQSEFFSCRLFAVFSLLFHYDGNGNSSLPSFSSNISDDDCLYKHETLTLKFAKMMLKETKLWAVYKTGKYAACEGVWFASTFAFRVLIKKVESDACHCWLKSLALFSGAESEIELMLNPRQGIQLFEILREDGGQGNCHGDIVSNIDLPDYIGKLSTAFTRVCTAKEVLIAVVTLSQPFHFQLWFWRLRAKMIVAITDIIRLLTSNVISGENVAKNDQQKMQSFAYDFIRISLCLNRLTKEMDLLATSFMDIDLKSFRLISRLALDCSLLAFCASFAINFLLLPSYLNGDAIVESLENFSVVDVVQDLVERLLHIDMKTSTDLQLYSSVRGGQRGHVQSRTRIYHCSVKERASLRVCQLFVPSLLNMQEKVNGLTDEGAIRQAFQDWLRLLSDLVIKWLHLPFQIPKYFFRLRACTGAELFAFSADNQSCSEPSITEGFFLPLNLCIQIKIPSPENRVKISKAYCILSVKASYQHPAKEDSAGQVQSTFQAWNDDEMVDLNDELMFYVRNGLHKARKVHGSVAGGLVLSFAHFELNEQRQGFSTCLLDVSSFGEGCYQIKWHSCCFDSQGSCWSLLALNAGPLFTVKKASACK